MSADCIFCKIIKGEIPSAKIYEDQDFYAFKDINPVAPFHVLLIPKIHKSSLNDFFETDTELLGSLLLTAKNIAIENRLNESGYRTVINTGIESGQTVFHLHLHIISGRRLEWKH